MTDEIYEKTLAWVNEVRFYEGLGAPLTAMPKGYRTVSTACPVARALCGAIVTPHSVEHPAAGIQLTPPPNVACFISFFDGGDYPELVAEEGSLLREPLPVAVEVDIEEPAEERELVLA